MSATTFAGAAQFAAISVLGAGGTVTAAVLAAVFLNARYAAISMTVASIFPGGRLRRLFESQAIVDESWAISGRRGRFEWAILVGAGLLFYVLWVASTAARDARRRSPLGPERDRARRRVRHALPRPRAALPPRPPLARSGCARRGDHARADPVHTGRSAHRRGVGRVPRRAAPVSASWVVVAVVGLATVAFKAAGPVIVGRRQLPPRLQSLVELLAPVMLTALVVTQTFGGDEEIRVDARVVGVAAALVALRLRAHIVVAMVVAAATTALVRLVF